MSTCLLCLGLTFFYLLVTVQSSQDDFTCVAGNFTAGKAGNVTCHFGPDIYKAGYHFEIVRYPPDAPPSHSGEDVLRCHRLGSTLRCTTGKGFEFDTKKVNANLTVIIPKVSKDQGGRYACQLIPPENRKKRLCELTVEETQVLSPDAQQGTDTNTVLVLYVVIGLLLILCGAFLMCLLRRTNITKIKELFCLKRKRSKLADRYKNGGYHLINGGTEVFPGDEEDAKENGERPYKVDIKIKYEVEDKCRFEDSEGYKRKYDDDDEERKTPYKVDIALDYEVADKSDSVEREGYERKYDRHDAAREKGYDVNISLDYKVEGKDETDEGYKPRRYDGDSEDEKRETLKFTIPPHHEWGDVQIAQTQPDAQPPRPVVHRDVIRSPTRRL